MSEQTMIYHNGEYGVVAIPLKDGLIQLSVRKECEGYYYDVCTCGHRELSRWWKPWTWGNRTLRQGLDSMVAVADQQARRAQESRWNIQEAERMIAAEQEIATALQSLEATL